MTTKSRRIAEMTQRFQGLGLDARYLAYFEYFNRQQYFEAHDVLEDLWLQDRQGPNGRFYKGLIQVAGGFVHLQKGRIGPAVAVFDLAERNLAGYGPIHEQLDISKLLRLVADWRRVVARNTTGRVDDRLDWATPHLRLLEVAA